jgi:L-threonylcarbamoyladenylate synthase
MGEPSREALRQAPAGDGRQTIRRIVDCLLSGGVVALPTDTVYGLAVLPSCKPAVDRLYALKGRPARQNLPVMAPSAEALDSLGVDLNTAAKRLFSSNLVPGALTIAMGFKRAPTAAWLEGRDEVAVRIPDDARLLAVLKEIGPLFVTSANAHGKPTPSNLAEVLEQLDGAPDLAIDGGFIRTVPSTLVNCRLEPPVVEREGAIPAAVIWERLK